MSSRPTRPSVARQILALQAAVVAFLLLAGATLVFLEARRGAEAKAAAEVEDLAVALAALPEARDAYEAAEPGPALRAIAEPVFRATGVDFIVYMDTDGVRYTHPNPDVIGERYIGTIEPALDGAVHTETYTGTLGPSVRSIAPVEDANGAVVGLVAVGILQENISGELRRRLPQLAGIAALAGLISAAGTWAIGRRLHRQTLGLGPAELTRMYEHHDAILHSVREGLVVIDDGRLVLANDEALRLLDLPPDYEGRSVGGLGLTETLAGLLASGRAAEDELHVVGDRVCVVSQRPARRGDRELGTVATLRDQSDLQALSGELDSVRGFAEALRAQAHESANRLHAMVTMIELGNADRAVEFATAELAASQQLVDRIVARVTEPALAALLLGKAHQAHERGIAFVIDDETEADGAGVEPRDLITLVGNLIDNAIDAALAGEAPRRVEVSLSQDEAGLTLRVADSGPGLATDRPEAIFTRGWSTKAGDRLHGRGLGLALVRQVIDRYGGTVAVEREPHTVFRVRLPRGGEGGEGS
ncbi:sensor histidine kinase [Glycomyces sp. TRM65418]|uniref:sensor histidine kinase n=1 Tax=Glycomyces sp. TRM65418 TaxID=2867006 RepID=UPI001CE5C63D|nr:sensor histidine kinase [Glycomyces sp. TRM65418]MCC3762319.1 sensor histidine kinase [Glycomyces sp. TRM65418]QZD56373.1 sensor histidine kinase [Glycomyces sp. TRM65418]